AEGSVDERGGAAGGDAADDVGCADVFFIDGGGAAFGAVFGAFLGAEHGVGAAGDDALDHFGVGAEGGRAFGGVEDAEAAAGAGAEVDEATPLPEGDDDVFDGAGDVGLDFTDGFDG